jgi:hypothetical protein
MYREWGSVTLYCGKYTVWKTNKLVSSLLQNVWPVDNTLQMSIFRYPGEKASNFIVFTYIKALFNGYNNFKELELNFVRL